MTDPVHDAVFPKWWVDWTGDHLAVIIRAPSGVNREQIQPVGALPEVQICDQHCCTVMRCLHQNPFTESGRRESRPLASEYVHDTHGDDSAQPVGSPSVAPSCSVG